jgi:hypothetical protein
MRADFSAQQQDIRAPLAELSLRNSRRISKRGQNRDRLMNVRDNLHKSLQVARPKKTIGALPELRVHGEIPHA